MHITKNLVLLGIIINLFYLPGFTTSNGRQRFQILIEMLLEFQNAKNIGIIGCVY